MHTALLLMVAGLTAAAEPPTKAGPDAPRKADGQKPRDEALRQELLRRMKADQDARSPLALLLPGPKTPDGKALKEKAPDAFQRMRDVDRDNTERMKQILDRHGWPGKSLVGADGAQAAWLLAQHADHDRPFQRRCLVLLREAVKKGEATGAQLAYLTDRLRVADKRRQVYGTQLVVVAGKSRAAPIEDEANVDRRRKEVGLPPLAEYLRGFEQALRGRPKGGPWTGASALSGRATESARQTGRPRPPCGPPRRGRALRRGSAGSAARPARPAYRSRG
jgi:hypothetical protein